MNAHYPTFFSVRFNGQHALKCHKRLQPLKRWLQFQVYIILNLPVGRLANKNKDWVNITEVHSSNNDVLINLVSSTPKPDYEIVNWIIINFMRCNNFLSSEIMPIVGNEDLITYS